MAIINDYSMKMVVKDNLEQILNILLQNREFALLTVDMEEFLKDGKYRCEVDHFKYELGDPNVDPYAPGIRYILLIGSALAPNDTRKKESHFKKSCKRESNKDGCEITFPSIDELVSMADGKEFLFRVHFIEENGNVENVINRYFRDDVLHIKEEEHFYLYDEHADIRVFLKKVINEPETQEYMQPADIREYEINQRILDKLNNIKNLYYKDAFTLEYASVSEKIQAQYFITKFFSNHSWDLDPICIFNFRISAFILPAGTSTDMAKKLPQNKTTYKTIDGTEYVIDSIHFGTDICDDLDEFAELIDGYYFDPSLA